MLAYYEVNNANFNRETCFMAIKAVIFDRDGTLNKTSRNEGGYILNAADVKLLPHVKSALEGMKSRGLGFYVFTQQRCIGKGLLEVQELNNIHARLNELLGSGSIDAFYYCPHLADAGCACSKPKPGMLFDILKDHNLKADEVLVVGDSIRDFESAEAAGLEFAFVPNDLGKHTKEEYLATGSLYFDDLEQLSKHYFG